MQQHMEAMDGRHVTAIGIGALALIVLVVMLISIVRSRRARVAAELDAQERTRKGLEKGDLGQDALTGEIYPTCIICGCKATCFAPHSGISWMDQLPLLNRLYCLSPRYIIEDNVEFHYQYCRAHHSMAIKRLEQFHSELRAQSAQFNAEQADKVAHMDAGGLEQIIREQHQKMSERLLARRDALNKVAQLPAAEEPEVEISANGSSRQVLSIVADHDSDDGEERLSAEAEHGS